MDHKAALEYAIKVDRNDNAPALQALIAACYLDLRAKAQASLDARNSGEIGGVRHKDKADAALREVLGEKP